MTSQMPQLFLKRLCCLSCIVLTLRNHCIVSTLRNDCIVSTLRNSSHLSASSRRCEDVKMLRVTLFTERGRCSEDSWLFTTDAREFSQISARETSFSSCFTSLFPPQKIFHLFNLKKAKKKDIYCFLIYNLS